mmetsp:Transcript_20629/g.43840  ORF Transcript_20629/g.43840 Transcript_20629/m.43840 type:complete len:213 (-) Transcript_20629:43-681(-)
MRSWPPEHAFLYLLTGFGCDATRYYHGPYTLSSKWSREQLCDGVQLDVGSAFVDCTNLGVAIKFLYPIFLREADSSHELHTFGGSLLRHLCAEQLCHCSVLHHPLAALLHARRVVDQQPRRLQLGRQLRHLVLHALEVGDRTPKLLALVQVGEAAVERPLCQPDHLSSDADPPLVEDLDGVLVALPLLPENIRSGHHDVFEQHGARRRRLDS